eukprot:1088103-Pyramimonas_sp.AAC.1
MSGVQRGGCGDHGWGHDSRREFTHDHCLEGQCAEPRQAVDMGILGPPGAEIYIHIHRPLGHQDVGSQAVDLGISPPRT